MSLNVQLMSDEELDACLSKVTKIPDWKIRNTQSNREHRRIRNIEIHRKLIKEQQRQQLKRQQRRLRAEKSRSKGSPKKKATTDELEL